MIRSSTESKLAVVSRLGADRVDAGIGAAALRQLLDAVVDILLHEIERLGAGVAGQRQALRHGVDGDDPPGAQQEGAADRELADRAAAPDGDRVAGLDVAEIRRHVAGREDVRQEQHLLVGQPVRHLDRADIGIGHAQIFGLAAGDSRRAGANSRTGRPGEWPHSFSAFSWSGLVRSQPEKKPRLQKKHSPQEMVKGTTTRSPTFSFLFSAPTSTTSPMVSWPMMSPRLHRRDDAVVDVQVRAADGAGGDLDDGVARMLDLGIGHASRSACRLCRANTELSCPSPHKTALVVVAQPELMQVSASYHDT